MSGVREDFAEKRAFKSGQNMHCPKGGGGLMDVKVTSG